MRSTSVCCQTHSVGDVPRSRPPAIDHAGRPQASSTTAFRHRRVALDQLARDYADPRPPGGVAGGQAPPAAWPGTTAALASPACRPGRARTRLRSCSTELCAMRVRWPPPSTAGHSAAAVQRAADAGTLSRPDRRRSPASNPRTPTGITAGRMRVQPTGPVAGGTLDDDHPADGLAGLVGVVNEQVRERPEEPAGPELQDGFGQHGGQPRRGQGRGQSRLRGYPGHPLSLENPPAGRNAG